MKPASPANAAPSAKNQRVKQSDINTQCPHHIPVCRACAHQHADTGPVDEKIKSDCDQQTRGNDHQPERRVTQTLKQLNWLRERCGQLREDRLPPKSENGQLIEDQDQREGRQHLIKMIALIKLPHDTKFDGNTHHHGGENCHWQPQPEHSRLNRDKGADEGTDHIKRPMCQVDHAHDSEDQR